MNEDHVKHFFVPQLTKIVSAFCGTRGQAYSSTLKIEALRSSETLVNFKETTRQIFQEILSLKPPLLKNKIFHSQCMGFHPILSLKSPTG